jgi:hypothetical protein
LVWSERLNKLRDSWFSAKSIEVERLKYIEGSRALDGQGWPKALPTPMKLRKPSKKSIKQTDLWCKGLKSKGKQPRPFVKVPKQFLSGKRSFYPMTTRRWAWKQPSFEESVRAHWSRIKALKMYRGSRNSPKRRNLTAVELVAERSVRRKTFA